jgi:ketosteroid isomerase-like protein
MENHMDNYLADRIALQDVLLKYAAGVDERDFELYRTCFTDDVEVVGMAKQPVHGVEAWLEFVVSALDRYTSTQHMLGPQLATIDGDTAHCRTDLQAMHVLKDPKGQIFTLWATYLSDMTRTDDVWRIHRHELVVRSSVTG